MKTVSGAYLTASHLNTRYISMHGVFTSSLGETTQITMNDIVAGSVSITDSCVPNSVFDIGAANLSTLSISLGKSVEKLWSNLSNGMIEIFFSMKLEAELYEEFSLGVFDILPADVKVTSKQVNVTGTSRMIRFEKSLGSTTFSGKPYDILLYCCNKCNVILGSTQAEIEACKNGLLSFALQEGSNCETYRDVVMWISHLLCGFATINSEGKLVIKRFVGDSVYTVNKSVFKSSSFGDGVVDIDNVQMTIDGSLYEAEQNVATSKTIVLDENPFFLGNSIQSVRQGYIDALFEDISTLNYMPFKITFNGDPCLEVGDYITINPMGYKGLITKSVWKFKGQSTIEGVGFSNTSSSSKSQSSKSTKSGGGETAVDNMKVTRYENIKDLAIGSSPTALFNFSFNIGAKVTPKLSFNLVLNVTTAGLFEITLRYDNVTLSFKPRDTLTVGYRTISCGMTLEARDVEMDHMLNATIKSTNGGVATLEKYQLLASVEAFGLSDGTEEFYGYLAVSDTVDIYNLGFNNITLNAITESFDIT